MMVLVVMLMIFVTSSYCVCVCFWVQKDVSAMFNQIDTDKSGFISQEEFVAFGKMRIGEIREVFDLMDKNRNGALALTLLTHMHLLGARKH